MSYWIFFFPVISALVGLLINYMTVSLLLKKTIVSKKNVIADTAGHEAEKAFEGFGLEEKINDPANLQAVLPVIEAHLDVFLNEKLKKEMPVISMFITSKTTDKLKEVFMREISSLFPQVIGKFAGDLKSKIDVKEMIRNKIISIPDKDIYKTLRKDLGIEIKAGVLGAISGFVIGLLLVILLGIL